MKIQKELSQTSAIIMYIKQHGEIVPALKANSNIIVNNKRVWFGASIDSTCRALSLQGLLSRDWFTKVKADGTSRTYRSFLLSKKGLRVFKKKLHGK